MNTLYIYIYIYIYIYQYTYKFRYILINYYIYIYIYIYIDRDIDIYIYRERESLQIRCGIVTLVVKISLVKNIIHGELHETINQWNHFTNELFSFSTISVFRDFWTFFRALEKKTQTKTVSHCLCQCIRHLLQECILYLKHRSCSIDHLQIYLG